MFELWKKHTTGVSLFTVLKHDTLKIITTLLLGDKMSTSLHRKYAQHHNLSKPTEKTFLEAYLDWASARITKPNKPLNAVETAKVFYPHLYFLAVSNFKKRGFK